MDFNKVIARRGGRWAGGGGRGGGGLGPGPGRTGVIPGTSLGIMGAKPPQDDQ